MWSGNTEAVLQADLAYLEDYSGWASSIHTAEARALVAAILQSEDRDIRKALSTRLMQSRVSALLSIGYLYVAVRERFTSSVLQARFLADMVSARAVLREASNLGQNQCWGFLRIPDPDALRDHGCDSGIVKEYVESGEQRRNGAVRIGQIARQDMLLSMSVRHRSNRVIVGSPRTVSRIKTGHESNLYELSNTAFYMVDMSDGDIRDAGDLVAVASPTTPSVVEEIVEEIEFIDAEAASTAALVISIAEFGMLQFGGPKVDC